jgi:hypothetical protein
LNLQDPIALALVRRSDQKILTLQGPGKVDLPANRPIPGDDPRVSLTQKLATLGVITQPQKLQLRWQGATQWLGHIRPITCYEARSWGGTPTDDCGWSDEEEITRGQRAEVYRRIFQRIRERAAVVDEGAGAARETALMKPAAARCPRCGASLRLRVSRPGVEARFDCGVCRCSWALRSGSLERILSLP